VAKDNNGSGQSQAQTDQLREELENAYAFLEGQKATQSFAQVTPEECFDQFIERIEGKDTQARPNVLHRLDKVKNDLMASIAKIKSMPAEAFREPQPEKDVNTKA
jgi:hypothetical protein